MLRLDGAFLAGVPLRSRTRRGHGGAPRDAPGYAARLSSLKSGEDPHEGVLREAFEETGLEGLRAEALLGQCDYPAPARNEIHRRNFFHLTCSDDPPEKWIHYERHPDEGDEDAIRFEFFWVDLPGGVPTLSPGHDRMIPKLLKALELA